MLLDTTQRALTHRLATAQVDGRAPSMVGAVVRGGDRAWSHAIESTEDTQYRIGSLTKSFVAVLVMRLRDEGSVDLADPLERHVPGTPIGDATLAQLLSHSAGLAAEPPGPWWERTPGALRPTLAAALGDAPMRHPAGRRFHYSNPGFAALGAVVEAVRRRPWGEVLQAEILDPLEMARTSLAPRAPHARGWAVHPWADVCMPEVVQDVGSMAPAGQMWSTVGDLGRFASLLLGGADGVLSADTVAEMRVPHIAPEHASWDASYGLGLQTLRAQGRALAGHTGSMPGFLCALWVCPEEDVAAVTLANTTSGLAIGSVNAELLSIAADREPRIPAPWTPSPAVDPSLLELTGPWYWGPAAYLMKLDREGRLVLCALAGASSRGARFRAGADGDWVGCNGYFHGERLRAVRDPASGQMTHLDIGSFVFTREPYDAAAPVPGGVDPAGWGGDPANGG